MNENGWPIQYSPESRILWILWWLGHAAFGLALIAAPLVLAFLIGVLS